MAPNIALPVARLHACTSLGETEVFSAFPLLVGVARGARSIAKSRVSLLYCGSPTRRTSAKRVGAVRVNLVGTEASLERHQSLPTLGMRVET